MYNTFNLKLCGSSRGRKTLYIKIKDGNPYIKSRRQMRAQVDTPQRKNKSKESTKIRSKPMQIGPMAMK
jgi:type III secretory pathway component EscU